jgi:S1-C subfamily serine protease
VVEATDDEPIVPGPLTGEDSVEPVADVARAVAPSVVLVETGIGQGSGIVWDAVNGFIVTNDHVVAEATTVQVRLADGAEVAGTIVGTDGLRDLAVIEIDPTGLELVEAVFAPSATVEVGQLAVAIGSPFGLDQTVTSGIVSAVNRINEYGGSDPTQGVPVEMIQTDAPINPGNSGGALADRQGRVIGMNTSIRTDGGDGNVGVGFALPSDTIVLIAERIVSGESLELAFLGVEGETPTDGNIGAWITRVVDGTAAAASDLEVNDLIVGVGDSPISSWPDLAAEIKLYRPGDVVDVEIVRDGERFVTQVALGDQAD